MNTKNTTKPTDNAPNDHTPNPNHSGGGTATANGHHSRDQRRAAQREHNGGTNGPHTDASAANMRGGADSDEC